MQFLFRSQSVRLYGLILLLTIAAFESYAADLTTLSKPLKLETKHITVSGLSAGAFMAQQLHLSHSARIEGVGIIAGGPYRCAAGHYAPSPWDFTGLYAALHVCMHTSPMDVMSPAPDVAFSLAETQRLAKAKQIDPTTHLANSRVWLFSGARDSLVPQAIMDKVADYYGHFVPAKQLAYVKHPEAGHALITEDEGGQCAASKSPFVNDCDVDSVGLMLQHFYGTLRAKTKAQPQALYTFNQEAFFNKHDDKISLHNKGHVYIPSACQQGKPCRLHIALHGCMQNQDTVGDTFYSKSGYNEWAESNQLVILYPQVKASSGFWGADIFRNLGACWDWWGYSGADYATRKGKQIQAIMRMVDTLTQNN